jgi:hypothetical protein
MTVLRLLNPADLPPSPEARAREILDLDNLDDEVRCLGCATPLARVLNYDPLTLSHNVCVPCGLENGVLS